MTRHYPGFEGTFEAISTETLSTFVSSVDRIGIFGDTENSNRLSLLVDWFRRLA